LEALIEENLDLIGRLGDDAVGKIMGLAMKEFRGRVDPAKVMKLIGRLVREAAEPRRR
jgi:Glu-tRNA(Gln) amidotransferase subunit E-like FAD-binding protein